MQRTALVRDPRWGTPCLARPSCQGRAPRVSHGPRARPCVKVARAFHAPCCRGTPCIAHPLRPGDLCIARPSCETRVGVPCALHAPRARFTSGYPVHCTSLVPDLHQGTPTHCTPLVPEPCTPCTGPSCVARPALTPGGLQRDGSMRNRGAAGWGGGGSGRGMGGGGTPGRLGPCGGGGAAEPPRTLWGGVWRVQRRMRLKVRTRRGGHCTTVAPTHLSRSTPWCGHGEGGGEER